MDHEANPIELSIVTTMYCSAPYLEEFHARATKAALQITPRYEIIFVNDGSPDNAMEIALALYHADTRVKIIDLSRNFGHHKAMMTGLMKARGDLVFLLDCDLEESPEALPVFHDRMKKEGADVVFGVQESRKGGLFERVSGSLFWSLYNFLTDVKVPPNLTTMRLMTQQYVRNLTAHRDQTPFLAGLWEITGFKQIPVTIKKHSKGSSSYTWSKRIQHVFNSITSFSAKPLIMLFLLGGAISLLSLAYIVILIVRYWLNQITVEGWMSVIVSVWFFGGLTIASIGLVGVYVSRVFVETKVRPYTVVRAEYTHDGADKAGPSPPDLER